MLKRNLSVWCLLAVMVFALTLVAAGPVLARGLTHQDIEALRQRGQEQGWTFTVGENWATQYDL
jgi:hypothetical protein